tara:strand:- start:62 stop:397 length:336 start_codon:yes stop_codon:yes gene_type:complete
MLVTIILLQSSKSGGMGAAISGQAMNEAFGGEGADKLLVRMTGGLAFIFMSLAIAIGWIGNPSSEAISIQDPIISRNKSNDTLLDAPSEPLSLPDDIKKINEASGDSESSE